MVYSTPRLLYPWEGNPVPVVQEAGWASEPVWMVPENVVSTGVRTPDSPSPSDSLYRYAIPPA